MNTVILKRMNVRYVILNIISILSSFNSYCFHKHYSMRIQRIEELFIQYKQFHSKEVILAEYVSQSTNLCNRRYIHVGKIPNFSFGNHIIEQTYGMIYGIILNRTVIRSTVLGNRYLHFRDWIIDDKTLQEILLNLHCDIDLKYPGYTDYNLTSYYNFIDESKEILLNFPIQELNPYRIFNVYSNASVMPSTQKIINLLYSHPAYYLSNFEVLGFAFNHIMKFSNDVIDYSRKSLQKILDFTPTGECVYKNDSTVISMHLRHQSINESYTEFLDQYYCALLRQSLRHDDMNKCFVLLASDRNVSISYMEACAISLNCTSVVNHALNSLTEEELDVLLNCKDEYCKEHGIWGTGINQIADLYFLSFGQRALIFDISTFGHVAGQLISYNQAVYHGNENDHFSILGRGIIRKRYSYYDGDKLVDYKDLSHL